MIGSVAKNIFPMSLSALNERLETCTPSGDFEMLGLSLSNQDRDSKDFFQTFLRTVEYPLRSYKDASLEGINEFGRHVIRIFPIKALRDDDRKAFQAFMTSIRKKFTEPQQAAAPKSWEFPVYLSNNINEIKEAGSQKINAREVIYTIAMQFKNNAKSRLKYALEFSGYPKTDDEKALKLQIILTLLTLEDELLCKNWMETALGLESLQLYRKLDQNWSRVRLDPHNVIMAHKQIPGEIDDAEELGFRLQFQECLSLGTLNLKWSGIKDIARIDAMIDGKTAKMESLMAGSSNKNVLSLANTCLDVLHYEKKFHHFSAAQKQLYHVVGRIFTSKVVKEHQIDFEDAVAPFSSFLLHLIKDHMSDISKKKEVPDAIDEELYTTKQTLNSLWKIVRVHQSELFTEAFLELTKLIEEKNRDRAKWYGYKTVLAEMPESPGGKAHFEAAVFDVPCHNDFIFQKPKEEMSTTQQVEIDSPSPLIKDKSQKPENLPQKKKNRNRVHHKPREEQAADAQPLEDKPACTETAPIVLQTVQEEMKPLLPGLNFPFHHAERVIKWIVHPYGQPLKGPEFADYADSNEDYQRLMHLQHAFPLSVDRFIHLGLQDKWFNSKSGKYDDRYNIAAEMTINGKKQRGIITYCVDENGVCYHRFFTKKRDNELVHAFVERAFYGSDFPELKAAAAQSIVASTQSMGASPHETIAIDQLLGIVTIEDKARNITVKLFPVSKVR